MDTDEARRSVDQSATLKTPASVASFDTAAHVQKEHENSPSRTCADSPEAEEKPVAFSFSELPKWAMANFAVDPVQSSKNRWKIRVRCRKAGCKHEGHLKLKTVSFISDSAYKQITRSKRKYELWKKTILAENARALRKSD